MNYEERLDIDTHGVLFGFLYFTWLVWIYGAAEAGTGDGPV